MRWRSLTGLAALTTVVAVGLTTTAAPAATAPTVHTTTSAVCSVAYGTLTAGGSHYAAAVSATVPPSARGLGIWAQNVYPSQVASLSGTMSSSRDPEGAFNVSGLVVLDGTLYSSLYNVRDDGEIQYRALSRIGSGWGAFRALSNSRYTSTAPYFARSHLYGLRGDGVLFRWTEVAGVWRNKTSYAGFGAVKSMALISQTKTYDTFLANTRTGTLITIHIPTTSPLKPVVKRVRQSTWQVFETLVAQKCGVYGTLVLGIDKDKQAGYLYAVGHATGPTTAIQSRGKAPGTFRPDSLYFRWSTPPEAPPFGE